MGMKITHRGPDFKGQVAAKKIKAAVDAALENHRKKYLPRHFEPEARRLYPEQYKYSEPNRQQKKRRQQQQQKVAAMTNSERREFFASRYKRNQRRRNRARREHGTGLVQGTVDKYDERPLYYTGRSENAILNGHAEFQGPVSRRRMKLNPPYYFFIKNRTRKGHMFDKVAALKAMRPEEDIEFGRVMDKVIQNYLNETGHKSGSGSAVPF